MASLLEPANLSQRRRRGQALDRLGLLLAPGMAGLVVSERRRIARPGAVPVRAKVPR